MRPDYRDVTLHDLMLSQGGVVLYQSEQHEPRGLFEVLERTIPGQTPDPRRQRELVTAFALEQPPVFPPRTRATYSNVGWAMVGHVAERVAGAPFERLVEERVFAPLGMRGARIGGWPASTGEPHQPRGHHAGPAGPRPLALDDPYVLPAWMNPAGGIHCAIDDFAAYAQEILLGLRGEGRLLPQAMYQRIHTPHGGERLDVMYLGGEGLQPRHHRVRVGHRAVRPRPAEHRGWQRGHLLCPGGRGAAPGRGLRGGHQLRRRRARPEPGALPRDGAPMALKMEGLHRLRGEKQVKAYLHPVRMRIVQLLSGVPRTQSQVARALGVHPANLTYPFRKLAAAKLIRLVEERDTGRVIEKYYQAVAARFELRDGGGKAQGAAPRAMALLRDDLSAAIPQLGPEAEVVCLLERVHLPRRAFARYQKKLERWPPSCGGRRAGRAPPEESSARLRARLVASTTRCAWPCTRGVALPSNRRIRRTSRRRRSDG